MLLIPNGITFELDFDQFFVLTRPVEENGCDCDGGRSPIQQFPTHLLTANREATRYDMNFATGIDDW